MTAVNSCVISRLAEILVQSSLLIAVVLALRAVSGKRLDKRLRYYLWLPVMLRLLLPFSVGCRLSVMNLLTSVSGFGAESQAVQTGTAVPADTSILTGETARDVMRETVNRAFHWESVLLCVWLIGAAAVALTAAGVNIRFFRGLKKDRAEADMEMLPRLCGRLGIKRVPAVYLSDKTGSPCAAGLFRPAVYLPRWAVSDRERLRYILMHELTHIKYRDNLISLLILACCAVYWFDPFVWIMAYAARRDRELACDARVTRGMEQNERTAYGLALVSAVEAQFGYSRPVCAPAFAACRKEMLERIVSIKNGRLVTKRAAVTVCAVMLLALVTAGTSAKTAADNGSLSQSPPGVSEDGAAAADARPVLLGTVRHSDDDAAGQRVIGRRWMEIDTLFAPDIDGRVYGEIKGNTSYGENGYDPGYPYDYQVIEETGVGRRIYIVSENDLRRLGDKLYVRVQ